MVEEEYKQMLAKLQSVVQECTDIVNKFQDKDHFVNNLTVHEANQLITKARNLTSVQDQILKEEFIHIMCMGNLTITQEVVFIRLIRALANTRSYIKFIGGLQVFSVGVFKKASDYECKQLGIKLKSTRVGM